jgi:hypothetical protein
MDAAEAALAGTPMHAALVAGDNQLSLDQTITFTLYNKVILPIDGYVFWVRADLLSASAVYGSPTFDTVTYRQGATVTPATTLTVEGSFHIIIDKRSNEDETIAVNRVIFTAHTEVQEFNLVGPDTMWIGDFPTAGGTEQFAFRQRESFYEASTIYHYVGEAIYPALASQIINGTSLDINNQIVSDSLPIWLSIPRFTAAWWNPQWSFPLYPSYVVPDNVTPPYGVIHIMPEQTQALQAVPFVDQLTSDYQLARDLVRITIYGSRNTDARSFLLSVLQYIRNVDTMGLMNMPIIRDEKRTQAELSMIAMKKTIDFEVSYIQGAARNIARLLILEAIPTLVIDPFA